MKVKALIGFSGLNICMSVGEEQDINDDALLEDLLGAGYVTPAEQVLSDNGLVDGQIAKESMTIEQTAAESDTAESKTEDPQTENLDTEEPKQEAINTEEPIKEELAATSKKTKSTN